MTFWRSAGLTYVRYSQIAATITRKCMKGEPQVKANVALRITKWESGKPIVKTT